MPENEKSWTTKLAEKFVALCLTGALSLGVWIVSSITEQNVRLAELLLEVKSVNERLNQYATKDELHQLEKKLDLHIATSRK